MNTPTIAAASNSDGSIHDRNASLSTAYDAVAELVSFLSSDGNLPAKIATPEFFDILEKAREKTLTSEEEFIFWSGYSQLAEHAKPTQVEALQFRNYILGRKRVAKETESRYRSNHRSIKTIRLTSLLSFFATLLFLTYLSLSAGLMQRTDQLAQEYRLIASGIYNGTRLEELQQNQLRSVVAEENVGGSEGTEEEGQAGGVGGQLQEDAYFRAMAVSALGEIADLPVIEEKLLEAGETYRMELRSELDIEALPVPLRPTAYMSGSWKLKSEWSTWRIRP